MRKGKIREEDTKGSLFLLLPKNMLQPIFLIIMTSRCCQGERFETKQVCFQFVSSVYNDWLNTSEAMSLDTTRQDDDDDDVSREDRVSSVSISFLFLSCLNFFLATFTAKADKDTRSMIEADTSEWVTFSQTTHNSQSPKTGRMREVKTDHIEIPEDCLMMKSEGPSFMLCHSFCVR